MAQDLLETPTLAYLEGIHRGKVSALPRLKTELQQAIRQATSSPGQGFLLRTVADRVLPKDPFER
jgi:hypothetical protein